MKKYIGTKIIEAEPMTRVETVDCSTREGYRVRYADGYESWSPKEAFDEAYRPTDGLPFGLAIEALKRGKKLRRRGWNGKNQYIELAALINYRNPDGIIVMPVHDAIDNKAIAFIGTSGVQVGWLASQADMLAEDWEIVDA